MEDEPRRVIEPKDLYRKTFIERNNRPPQGKELEQWPKQYLREILGRDFGPEDCWVDYERTRNLGTNHKGFPF